MNLRYVLKQLGLLHLVLSGFLLAVATVFFIAEAAGGQAMDRGAALALFFTGAAGAGAGGLLWWLTRRAAPYLGRRESLLLVAASWLVGTAFAAMPYYAWARMPGTSAPADHAFKAFIDCYFESMSGLTTTGASVLADVGALPRSLLLWRAFTQWIGGLGIVVLFVAVLPSVGAGGKRLFLAEVSGPAPEGLQPQIRQTARVLLYIYTALNLAQIAALLAAGMSLFDAVCHAFSSVATGGFSTRTASAADYNLASQIIMIVFVALGGVNFAIYYALLRRRYATALRDTELRLYLGMLAGGAIVVVLCLLRQPMVLATGETVPASAGHALRHGVFTFVSIATTTGFATADYNPWPFAAQAVLVLCMFIGASAGSTAGGIKLIRVWIAIKVMLSEIEHVFRPQVVRPVRVGRSIIDDELKLGTIIYVLGYILLFALGSAGVMILEQLHAPGGCDYTTAASATIACMSSVGPGLGRVGAIGNYGWMSGSSKALLSLLMVLGRLEFFPIVVLLTPRFWRGN
jgi:trk system potassium uptake protein TrkH